MRVLPSARKHGVREEDMLHALRHYVRVYDLEDGMLMFIGPSTTGAMLEVGLREDQGDPRLLHAMPMRARFRLPGDGRSR